MNARISLERLLDKADNSIYKLVLIAAQRAKELAAGKPVLLEAPESDKPTTIALEEIAAGKVRYKALNAFEEKEKKISSGHQEVYQTTKDEDQEGGHR